MYRRRIRFLLVLFFALAVVTAFFLVQALFVAREQIFASVPQPRVVSEISFASSRAGFLVANPYTAQVFAAMEDVPALAHIDGNTDDIVSKIPLLGYHIGMTIDLVKNEIYVTQQFSQTVRVIDGVSNKILRDLPVPGGSPIGELAFDSNTSRVYVIQNDIQTIAILDYQDGALLGTLPIDAHYGDLALNPQTQRLYVSSPLDNRVTVVDTANDSIVAKISVGKNPLGIAVNPATNRVYVTIADDDELLVLDGATNTRVAAVQVHEAPLHVAVNPLTNRVYVANLKSKDVAVIDGETNQILYHVPLKAQPGQMAVLPDLHRVFVASDQGHGVYVIQDNAPGAGNEIVAASNENTRALWLQETEPPAQWNESGFADEAWERATPMTCITFGELVPFRSAQWIWLPGCSQRAQTVLLRETFDLPSRNFEGALRVRASDTAQVYLNGNLLGAPRHWTTEYWYDLTPHLRAGKNVLAIQAWNGEGGYGGVLFRAELRAANIR